MRRKPELHVFVSPAKLQSLIQPTTSRHRAGGLAEAEDLYRQAMGAKRSTEAEKHLRDAVGMNPDFHLAWDRLAYCLKSQNRFPEAIAFHEKALALAPNYAPGWYNLGLVLSLAGRSFDALACHDRALVADPNFTIARFGRAQALQQTLRIPEAVDEYDRFLAVQPHHHAARSHRLFALHCLENIARDRLLEEHVTYGLALGSAAVSGFRNSPDPRRSLRVAVLSPDLRAHSCAFFIEPILQHLDAAQFEVYLYHDHFIEDEVSERLRKHAAVWWNFAGQSDPAVEKVIRADAPDIIIDLAGHTGLNRLPVLARRVAPVQITYLGYPNTTGVAAMDYRFTDSHADPVGDADVYATEQLVRFAPTAWAYAPSPDAPEVATAPCSRRGHVTFGCFNDLAKITDGTFELWGRVLNAVPGARLQLKGCGLSNADVRSRYGERMRRCGMPEERVDFIASATEATGHLAPYNDVDVAFDTFPYHGTTTTCEALWMGVPVVTLAGDEHRSRVGVSLLSAVNRREWIANDREEFVRLAVELARDTARLAEVRRTLRGEMAASALLDHVGQAAHFGAALRACWTVWCEHAATKAA